jgi:hypothetical protein
VDHGGLVLGVTLLSHGQGEPLTDRDREVGVSFVILLGAVEEGFFKYRRLQLLRSSFVLVVDRQHRVFAPLQIQFAEGVEDGRVVVLKRDEGMLVL